MPTYVSNDLTRREWEVVTTMAECDLNQLAVARQLGVHLNTVRYNIERICDKSGLDPRKFYDLQKLLSMAEGGA